MSGIYGVWQPIASLKEYAADIGRLKGWNRAYGKVAACIQKGETLCMGNYCERLSDAIPESVPVIKKNEKYAVIDALLYNREELIEEGQFENPLSDEELIFGCIEKYGMDGLKRINGDFCGAVYDTEKESLTVFRDHMGKRPLFCFVQEEGVCFSTDIRGLVAMESVDVSVDEKWLWSKLTGGVYPGTENTEFANIRCIRPGGYTVFTMKDKKIRVSQKTYWYPGAKKIRLSSQTAYMERLRELITDSVRRRLAAVTGPVGAELSGGLDSGVIDILIHQLGREAVYFSWSASPAELPYAENDERLVVEDICKKNGITCHYRGKRLVFEEDCILHDKMRRAGIIPDMTVGFYKRYVFPPYINTLQICQAAEYVNGQGAKVIFTGHGGDEGVSHRCNPYELFFYKEYGHYFQYMWNSTKGEKHRLYKTLLRSRKNLTVSAKKLKNPFVGVYAAKDMLKKDFYDKYNTKKGEPVTFAFNPKAYVRNGGSRNRLEVVALLGAYCGARYIAPYLDYRVIDYAISIPRHLYLKNQENRYLFRETFKDILPESLYQLKGKEDTSWQNLEVKEKDPDAYLEKKSRLVNMLDKAYWNRYLDWEVLEQWSAVPLEDADKSRDAAMYTCIDNCLSLQNLITFSRAAKPEAEDENESL